jgi:hypothetical protein
MPAIESLDRALALQPVYANARNNLGNALREQGRIEEAVAEPKLPRSSFCAPGSARSRVQIEAALVSARTQTSPTEIKRWAVFTQASRIETTPMTLPTSPRIAIVTGADAKFLPMAGALRQSLGDAGWRGDVRICDFGLTDRQAGILREAGILLSRPARLAPGIHHFSTRPRWSTTSLRSTSMCWSGSTAT